MTQIVQSVAVRPKRSPYVAAAAFFLLLGVIGVVALLPKLRHREDLRTEAAAAGGPPVVLATRLVGGEKNSRIELPASIQAFAQTTIFARTSGYIKQRYVDIGDHVRKGQLLAVIEDPQTDQQLLQARATLAQTRAQLLQAQANAELSSVTNERWQSLQKAGVVAMQDADQKRAQSSADAAAVAAAKANIAANEANVASLTEQASFERVTAPFAGIILSRSIDTGSLISVGSQNSVQQMFTLAQSDTVRVFANVPQEDTVGVRQGQTAQVAIRELGGLDLPPTATAPVMLPANALVIRTAGPQAVVIDKDNIAHFRPLVLGRDVGSATEVLRGVQAGDLVVLSPGDSVVDGAKVEPEIQKAVTP
jgi:multidrug efflux pump subunit AcrA (membrane-fusion protein)